LPLITKSEAADALGVSRTAVYKAIKQGRLPVVRSADGRELIKSETLREDWFANTMKKVGVGPKPPAGEKEFPPPRPKRRAQEPELPPDPPRRERSLAGPEPGEIVPDYNESRARNEYLKAELLELERKEKEGLLVRAADVEAKWVEVITISRTKVLGVPSKAKQRIPDLTQDQIAILDDIVREALEELAEGNGSDQ
jgi:excisionase family DNA binding protein